MGRSCDAAYTLAGLGLARLVKVLIAALDPTTADYVANDNLVVVASTAAAVPVEEEDQHPKQDREDVNEPSQFT
jgi:hypothetical protein